MKKIKHLLFISIIGMLFFACTKGPGEGGRASIKGTVYARNYSNSFVLNDSGLLGGQKVYIKYGDQPGIGDNADTDPNGEYYFNYLREGKYQIITYTKLLTNNTLDSAIVKEVVITSRKEEVVVPQIDVISFKN
jgi:hypothetical protein